MDTNRISSVGYSDISNLEPVICASMHDRLNWRFVNGNRGSWATTKDVLERMRDTRMIFPIQAVRR